MVELAMAITQIDGMASTFNWSRQILDTLWLTGCVVSLDWPFHCATEG